MSTAKDTPPEATPILPVYWEGWFCATLLMVLCSIIFLQILGRFGVFPGQVWTEELTRWVWVWLALVGCAATQAHDQHLRMEVLTSFLPKKIQTKMSVVQRTVGFLILMYLAWQGYKGVLRTWHNEAVTLPVSDAVLYTAMPVAMLLWGWRMLKPPQQSSIE